MCQAVEQARAAGPLGDGKTHPGYHLTLYPIDDMMWEAADDG